jgi:LuxR family maltose regulon positive regulatory protein
LADERAQAYEELSDAASRPLEPVATLARAQLVLLAADDPTWDDADLYAYAPPSAPLPDALRALVLTAAAVAGTQRGDIAQARCDARHAVALLASSTVLTPWLSAETQAWLARAELKLSDGPTARMLLARAASAQAHVIGAPALARWVHDGWALADAFAATATGDGPALTIAELRVLRLLESCMSYREIGERLHVSPNTVKSQALAVYRKFDVCRRTDAVECGRVAGLIGP